MMTLRAAAAGKNGFRIRAALPARVAAVSSRPITFLQQRRPVPAA